MSNTGHASPPSSSSATLVMTRVDAIARNVAVATALPNTSWAQLKIASGVTLLEQSPNAKARQGLRDAREAEWQRIQKELFARHAR